jgi:hypothetical protein
LNSYKINYIAKQLLIVETRAINIYNNDDDENDDIYIENEKKEINELNLYLEKKKSNKSVSFFFI